MFYEYFWQFFFLRRLKNARLLTEPRTKERFIEAGKREPKFILMQFGKDSISYIS